MEPSRAVQANEYVRLGRVAEAEELIHRSLQDDPSDPAAYVLLARAQLKDDRLADSLASTERALALDPNHLNAHHVRATGLHLLRDWEGCVAQCDAGLRISPDQPGMLGLRGLSHLRVAVATCGAMPEEVRNDPVAAGPGFHRMYLAGQDISRAVAVAPENVWALESLAEYELINQWVTTGWQTAERALKLDPNRSRPHLLVGFAMEKLGNTHAASAAYARAGMADPTNQKALENLRRMEPEQINPALFAVSAVAGPVAFAMTTARAVKLSNERRKTREAMSPEAQALMQRDKDAKRRR